MNEIEAKALLNELLSDSDYTEIYSGSSNEPMNVAINLAIEALEKQLNSGWIPISEMLPNETGEYLCNVEWYGTSTKELLKKNKIAIEQRILIVHFLKNNSYEKFKECDDYCTYKVIAWQPLPEAYRGTDDD